MKKKIDHIKKYFLKKLLKKLLIFFLGFIGIVLVLGVAVVTSDTVQTYVAQRVAHYFSEQWHTDVEIGRIHLGFFDDIGIEHIYISDQNRDTLVFIDYLGLVVNDFSIKNHSFDIGKVTIEKAVFNYKKDTVGTNFQFLEDYFASSDTLKTDTAGFSFTLHKLVLKDSRVHYERFPKRNYNHPINYRDLFFTGIYGTFDSLQVDTNYLKVKIKKLRFHEQSGWQIQQFGGNVCLRDNHLKISDFLLVTPKSDISADSVLLKYHSKDDFLDFTNKVRIQGSFRQSVLDMSDLVYFANSLKSFRQHFSFSGNVKGKISNLQTKNLQITWGHSSELNISGEISGLPDLNNTFLYVDLKKMVTNKQDIENLLVFANENDSIKKITVPKIISQLGNISYKGNITGFYNDLVAYGHFHTDLGNFKTDISLKQDTATGKVTYKGFLQTKGFEAGKFLEQDSLLGEVTLKGMIDGYSLGKENFTEINAEVQSFYFNNYLYHNFSVDGTWKNEGFSGNVFAQDTNLEMSFSGDVDLSDQNPVFDFTMDVTKARLRTLHLIKDSLIDNVEFMLEANMTGKQIDSLQGHLSLTNGMIYTADTIYPIDGLQLTITKDKSGKRLEIRSFIADFSAEWNLSYKNILPFTYQKLSSYYSFLPVDSTLKFDTLSFIRANLNLKQSGILNFFLGNTVRFTDFSKFNFNLGNSPNKGLTFQFNAPNLTVMNQDFSNLHLSGNVEDNNLHLNMRAAKIKIPGNLAIKQVHWDSWLLHDTADMSLTWNFSDTVTYGADLQAEVFFQKQLPYQPKVMVNFIPSFFIIQDTLWYLNDAHVVIDTAHMTVEHFILNRESEYLFANGGIAFNGNDTLNIILNDFSLSHFNNFLKPYYLNLNGKLNGNAKVITYEQAVSLISDLNIAELKVNNEQFGKTTLKTVWNQDSKKLNVNLFTQRGKLKPIHINGDYLVKTGGLNFNISFQKLLLRTFKSMTQENLSNLKGLASGNLTLKGTTEKPLLEGVINLQKTSFIVNYLGTKYNLTTPVYVTYDGFKIKNATLNDDFSGKSAILNASLTHRFFKNFKYEMKLESDNFLLLHTTEEENPLFYGTVFAGGVININGSMDLVNISADVQTRPKTIFNLSLSSSEEAEEYHFVQFVKHGKDTVKIMPQPEKKITGINLDLDIDATEDATVKLIFDEKVGDMIKAKGKGAINFKMDRFGKINMTGDYKISSGNYLFTLQNIINKRFEIENGGSIKWNGNPYEAFLDVKAVYPLKTSLYDLTLDSLDKKKVPVECQMKISDRLSDPKIKFSIGLPNNNNNAEALLSSMSQDEISKQILTLLLLNRFYTPENLRASSSYQDVGQTSAFGINSSELLSNQVSNWLSQISDNFDVGIKYTPGNEISKDELEVALSTQIFNDRLLINGNVSTGGGTMENSSTVAGDVSMELKINKSGNLRLKGYNKSNANDLLLYQDAPYTQGVGFYYTEEFNSLHELTQKYLNYLKKMLPGKFRKKEKKKK